MPPTISKEIYRRFIIGKQGLWPGRRWQGKDGVTEAIRCCEFIQIDPITIMQRSHDIALQGRVLDYTPDQLMTVMYGERHFFDWGGWLIIVPIQELPYWRGGPMEKMTRNPRWLKYVNDSADVVDQVRAALRERSPLGNRDFEPGENAVIRDYRSGKQTGIALYSMWLSGEVMTHSRSRSFERQYAFTEQVAPPEYQWIANPEESFDFLTRKAMKIVGMTTAKGIRNGMQNGIQGWNERTVSPAEAAQHIKSMLDAGDVVEVKVEHIKEPCYMQVSDVPLLDDLIAGRIPEAWQPVGPTTRDEVTFLAPLEIVSARGRAATVFDFEYIWEVYKPLEKRRWGYYVLPILYGDRLVARMDAKLDRKTMTFMVLGFWMEDHQPINDPDFIAAFGRGLARFAQFHAARAVDLSGIPDAKMRSAVSDVVNQTELQKS